MALWHWRRTLRALVAPVNQRRFSRDFGEVYEGLDLGEVIERARPYAWRGRKPCGHVPQARGRRKYGLHAHRRSP
jgi:hypothetical protein